MSDWVKIALVVFDKAEQTKPLLRDFSKRVRSNLSVPELEDTGSMARVEMPGGHKLPGWIDVAWLDVDAEEALDEWAEGLGQCSPFLLIAGFTDKTRRFDPLTVWAKHSDGSLSCQSGFDGEAFALRVGVEPEFAVDTPEFLSVALSMVLEDPEFEEFRRLNESLLLAKETKSSPSSRSSAPRL